MLSQPYIKLNSAKLPQDHKCDQIMSALPSVFKFVPLLPKAESAQFKVQFTK